jgi:hypothetical protein
LSTVNDKWFLPVARSPQIKRGHVPVWDLPAGGVQRACNTKFEFVFSRLAHLDKNPIWQHAGNRITDDDQIRFRRVWTGAGT